MLTPEQTREVSRLLKGTRLSYRAIASRAGVSRGSVAGLAARRWTQANRGDQPGQSSSERVYFPSSLADLQRCPDCGALVVLPCRACKTRRRAKRFPVARLFEAIQRKPLGLELKPKHAARYHRVRQGKLKRLSRDLDRELQEREGPASVLLRHDRRRVVDLSVMFEREFRKARMARMARRV